MTPFLLADLGIIRIRGEDRTEFLQGQLTQDLGEVTPTQTRLWGWNNAKGRLLLTGQAVETGAATLLIVRRELIDSAVQRLKMFVLRARVEIDNPPLAVAGLEIGPAATVVDGLALSSSIDVAATEGDISMARLIGDPTRALLAGPAASLPQSADARASHGWELADVRAGIPCISAATTEAFVPQMINLDLVGGISFTKGCYVGQEVVARTHNLGRIKRRMFRFAGPAPAEPGNEVVDSAGNKAGQVVRCAAAEEGHELLAVVQLSAVEAELFVGDARLERLPLPYPIPEAD